MVLGSISRSFLVGVPSPRRKQCNAICPDWHTMIPATTSETLKQRADSCCCSSGRYLASS